MAAKKDPIPVVTINSSDEDEEERTSAVIKSSSTSNNVNPPTTIRTRLQTHMEQQQQIPSSSSNEALISRSFWKAGDFEAAGLSTTSKYDSASELLEHARVHPKFLHSNATSHKWAFGAIAELLDNAIDEIHNGATFVKVDKVDIMKDNSPALLFQDDGGGMTPEGIRKCMSLGYSSKKTKKTIGQYGNGFKTSTMRLGADVIVFSRAIRAGKATQSVGLLSYTFLRKTGLDDIIVPMIDFDTSNDWAEPIIYGSSDDLSRNLKTILEWSPFSSKDDLMHQFEDIGSHGTKIIIFNLWLNDEGVYELSFDDDEEDIRLRDETNCGDKTRKLHYKVAEIQSHISYRLRYSLRAYASVLYLRKFANFKIFLRGKPVEQFHIANELKYSKVVTYKPQVAAAAKEEIVETTIGFMAPHLDITGYNVYHKNRLIRPFWKVTAEGQSKGYGVVGVLEVNFIEPAHDKQDFERSSLYIRLEARLKQMLLDYWKGHCHLVGYKPYESSAHKNQKVHLDRTSATLDSGLQKHKGDSCRQMSVLERVPSNHPPVNLAANLRLNMTSSSLVHAGAPTSQKDSSNIAPVVPCSSVPNATLDDLELMSVDQICEENVQLFIRCEEHKKRETELKQLIQKVEEELDETRKSCARLSSHMENQKTKPKQQVERI